MEQTSRSKSKSDDSPLTIADQRSNTIIVAGLRKHFPEVPIISEEEKMIPYAERKDWEYCWEVDPLDGTKEFINRNGEFAVCIALLHRGRAVAGIVHAPAKQLTAWARKGEGAFQKGEDGSDIRLESRPPAAGEQIAVVASRSHSSPAMQEFLGRFHDPAIRSAGSALKFLLLAKGEAHIYPRLAPTMEWDTSAGQIIVEEAGGEMLREDDRQPLTYNRENLRNPNFIAYAKGVRETLSTYMRDPETTS